MEKFDYSDNQIASLLIALYYGAVSLKSLPVELYKATANTLNSALYKGYGGNLGAFEFGKPDYVLLKQLQDNIYMFSGAKTATQCEDLRSLLTKDGEALSLAEYKKVAKARFEVYNGKDGYLESEYITAHTTASSAANFQEALEHKNLFPYLRSVAIIDKYTAPECARMNGVTAKVEDPIWNHNLAARHFRCRCHEEKIDKYENITPTSKGRLSQISKLNDEEMAGVFKMNPVYDKVIFNEKHQYFEIGKRFPDLGKTNFGLPIP